MADTLQGLFTDPRLLQQAQDAQLAQMTPNQRLFMMGRQTGRDIGQGLGGFFGVDIQDPAMAKASKLRELGAKYGTTTAEALDKIAAELQQTDPQMAMQVAEKANAMRASSSKLKLEEARTKSLTTGIGKLNPQNYTAESWAKYAESGDLEDLRDKPGKGATAKGPIGNISPKDFTPESMQSFLDSVSSGTPDYSLLKRVTPQDKGPAASVLIKASDLDTKISSLGSSVAKLGAIGSRINGLDLGLIQNFARGGQSWLGINTKDRVEFDAVRRVALQEANNLLLLAKGTQTEGDAQRARDQIADDNTWKNKEALTAAFDDLKNTHATTLEALKAGRATLAVPEKTPASTTQKTPSAAPASSASNLESKINKFMSANPGKSREAVIEFMKKSGHYN